MPFPSTATSDNSVASRPAQFGREACRERLLAAVRISERLGDRSAAQAAALITFLQLDLAPSFARAHEKRSRSVAVIPKDGRTDVSSTRPRDRADECERP